MPVPFECHYAALVEISKNVEQRIHRAFEKYRVNKNRGFFEIGPDAAADIIRMVAIEEITPEGDTIESSDDKDAIERLEKRAARFAFKMVGITPGTTLTFKLDDKITCTVLDNHAVEFEGEKTSLPASALVALKRSGMDWKSAQGAMHWMHQGKTLRDLRDELENE